MLASAQTVSKTRLTLVASTGVSDDLASSIETETWSESCREATMPMLINAQVDPVRAPVERLRGDFDHRVGLALPFHHVLGAFHEASSVESIVIHEFRWLLLTVVLLDGGNAVAPVTADSQHCEQNPHSPSGARSECWSAQLAWNLWPQGRTAMATFSRRSCSQQMWQRSASSIHDFPDRPGTVAVTGRWTLSVSANWRAARCFEICASLARRTSSIQLTRHGTR